jgi:hypothetical protein
MILNFDGWLGNQPPDVRRGIDFHLKASQDTAPAEKRRLASMFAVAEDTGLDLATVNERWMEVRGGYAEKLGGDWNSVKDDEDAFHGQLVKHVQQRKDERFLLQGPDGTADDDASAAARLSSLAALVSAAALKDEPYAGAWSAWTNAAKGKPGFDVSRLADYEGSARNIHNEMSRRVAEVKPAVDTMLAGLLGERDGSAGAYGGKDLVDAMEALPLEQRGLAQAMLATRAAAMGEAKAPGWQFWQAFGRGSAGLLVGTARTFEAGTLADAEKKLAALKPGDEIGGRFTDAYQFARGKSADSMEAQALGFVLEPVLKNKVLTQEEIDTAKAMLARDQDRLQIQMELEQVGKAALDPIKGANWFTSKIAYPFAESIAPQIGLALLTRRIAPVGTGLTGAFASSAGAAVPMWGMMADQNAQQLMQQTPGMGIAQAYDLGRKAAVFQTGLEYAGLMLGMGTLPKLGSAFKTMQGTTFLKTLAVGTLQQNAIEGAQDVMAPIAQALESDAPGVDWQTVFNGTAPEVKTRTEGTGADAKTIFTTAGQDFTTAGEAQAHAKANKVGGYWNDRIDTALALLPMVILGTGGKVAQAKAGTASLQRVAADMTDTKLHAAGIPEATRAAILAEPDAVKRLDAFSTALQSADRATAAEGAQRMQAEQQAREKALSGAMDTAGVTFETGSRDGTPIFQVTRGETTTEHASSNAALAAIAEHMDAADRAQNGPLLEMVDALSNNPLSPVQETTVTIQPGQSVADFQAERAAAMQDETLPEVDRAKAEKESAAMTNRMQVFEAAHPDTEINWQELRVGGQSELEVKEGVARAVLRITNGESAYAPLEEKAESEAAAWVQSGETTWQGLAGMIREVEAATGDHYLNGYTDGTDTELDATAIREAYSELAMVNATGKGRAGKPAQGNVAEIARMDRMVSRGKLREAIATGAVREGLAARLMAQVQWLKTVVSKAINLHRARRKAGASFAIDDFLNRSIGIEPEAQHAAGVVAQAQRIYDTPATEPGPTHRLTPVATLDRLSEQLQKRTRDPEQRRKVFDQMKAALDSLRRNWTGNRSSWNGESRPKVDKATLRELNKEQAFREAAAMADAVEQLWNNLTPSAQAALGMTGEDVSAYAGPLAQRFSGGRFGTAGRIQSRVDSLRNAAAGDFSLGGEYDGASGLPSLFFGGAITPDTAAQEAYDAGEISEATPDALWDSMRSELQTQARNKEAMRGALDAIKADTRAARAKAKQEAAAWRAEQDGMQAQDWDSRTVMLRHLRTLDALLSALPAEVRGKVGGWVAVASLKTQPAMLRELEHRLQVADEYLEEALKKDALTGIRALIEKASPKREGGKKPKGKLGAEAHRFFDEVERAAAMTAEEVSAEHKVLEEMLINLSGDPSRFVEERNRQADIFERQQVLDTFGALGKVDAHTAAHLTRALDLLETVYATGRNRWRMIEEARLEEVAGFQKLAIDGVGGLSAQAILDMRDVGNTTLGMLKLGSVSLKSFTETLEALLGRGHVLTARWSRAAREGMAQRTDEVLATGQDWSRALQLATGRKGRAARSAAWDMGTIRSVAVTKAPTATSSTPVPVEVIDQWTDGTANPAALDISKAEARELQDARAAMLEANEQIEAAGKGRPDSRQFLTLTRPTNGPVEAMHHTEAEAVYLSMLWAQEAYQPALRKAGYGEDAQAQIEDGLSDSAKLLRAWIGNRYGEGYAPLARQFRNMFGVDLPQIDNYAPGLFYNQGTADTALDVSGSGHVDGGFRSGFLKDRAAHTAEPRAENAFQVFFGHVNQTAHWKALAPLTRELRGVFGNPQVKQAILAQHGPKMQEAVNKWIESIEGNRLKVAHSQIGQWLYGMQAHVALAWKLGTIMKQSTALLGAAYRMPASDYLRGLGLLTAGGAVKLATLGKHETAFWQGAAKVYNSALIQRRIAGGFAPEIRAALAGAFTGKPTMRGDFLTKGMEMLGFADAFFTAGSAAIAYDYHFRQAKTAGLTDAQADAAAMNETADMVSRTAQPVEVTDRSLFEQSLGGIGKGIFVFSSEARQKSSMWLTAWGNTLTGKATAEDARVLVISHLIVGPLIQAITVMMRDRRDDDDDELFDPTNWEPLDFLKAAAAGPLFGIPLVRDLVDGYNGESGPLTRFYNAAMAGASLFEGPPANEAERVEWYGKKITGVLQGLDSFTAVTAGIAKDAFQTFDNLHDDPEEAAAKELSRLEKKADASKKAEEQTRRDALTPAERDAEDTDKEAEKARKRAERLAKLRAQYGR